MTPTLAEQMAWSLQQLANSVRGASFKPEECQALVKQIDRLRQTIVLSTTPENRKAAK